MSFGFSTIEREYDKLAYVFIILNSSFYYFHPLKCNSMNINDAYNDYLNISLIFCGEPHFEQRRKWRSYCSPQNIGTESYFSAQDLGSIERKCQLHSNLMI